MHVAGTRGKGSCCALIESALTRAGLRAGMTTSPHLLSPLERIRVGGSTVSSEYFNELAARVRPRAEELLAGYFEVMTAMAFLAFAESRVDVAVVETGLGGRVDATNVVRPWVTVVTRLGLDHADRLGGTRAAIAAEKAGILKAGARAVLAPNEDESAAPVRRRAAELGVPLREVTPQDVARAPATALPGEAQRENAGVALVALEELAAAGGVRVAAKPAEIAAGFASVRWRARLETLRGALGGSDVLLDVAHDVLGARALARHAGEPVGAVVFACLLDKDAEGIAGEIASFARAAPLFVPELAGARARPARELAALLRAGGLDARPCAGVAEALSMAQAAAGGRLVVAFGSFQVAADVLRALET